MLNKHKIVLGYAPTRRDVYPDKKYALENKEQIRKRINSLLVKLDNVELIDIDWLNDEGLLIENADVKRVEDHLKKSGVDAVFMPHCNFGQEEVVGKLRKSNE